MTIKKIGFFELIPTCVCGGISTLYPSIKSMCNLAVGFYNMHIIQMHFPLLCCVQVVSMLKQFCFFALLAISLGFVSFCE